MEGQALKTRHSTTPAILDVRGFIINANNNETADNP